ncbi:hypothetical protein BD324DRAFT_326330 [Kockovaella imperatae]|uniref:Uncharacterized protein n=1 Tax=Kockovaella imperatae TaxID=4999 RepID=A0A1Y1UQD0_9TREE|nr:hypothetical protein BD324DRAFT_326330 [Kockovaella imperatae]ORX39345.1 hypothetical protein BD324DRAFT_326330 [Kockovaella imperatae]
MSKTKNKAKRNGLPKGKGGNSAARATEAGPSSAPTSSSLIDKAHVLLAQSNFELAIKFLKRALELEPANLEAREVLGVAELEGGDEELGRSHLLQLFPPHTDEPPHTPSPYLYLAQTANDPREALGYYSTAAAMTERALAGLSSQKGKGRISKGQDDQEEEVAAAKAMAVTALIAMVEIWMSDLCFEPEAEKNCDDLISRALSISPDDFEARLSLASIRISQQRAEDAVKVIMNLYEELEEKEAFDPSLPALPTRLSLVRLLLENNHHLPALSIVTTAREEDSLEVESAYLEGWAWYLRAEALLGDPSLQKIRPQESTTQKNEDEEEEDGPESISAEACFSESMRALLECAQLFSEQDYPDEGIGSHVKELLENLEKRGVQPAEMEMEDRVDGQDDQDGRDWEDVEEVEDVEMD